MYSVGAMKICQGLTPFGHGTQTECVALFSTHSAEEAGVHLGTGSSNSRRSWQIARGRLH